MGKERDKRGNVRERERGDVGERSGHGQCDVS